jgi:hypothetical protein
MRGPTVLADRRVIGPVLARAPARAWPGCLAPSTYLFPALVAQRIELRPVAGVGVDASSASTDPAGGPWRSTASSCQVPGTPRSATLPNAYLARQLLAETERIIVIVSEPVL